MATWCESLTDQKRFYLPRDIGSRRAMRLVNIIAALLDENECDAPALAEAICNEIKASMPPESEYKPGRYQIAAPAKLHEFVDRFLNGSTEASALLLGILAKEVFGKDWIKSDHADASRAATRATFYGKPWSHGRRQLREQRKRLNWGQVDVNAEIAKAKLWVRAHHVHHSLLDACYELVGKDRNSFDSFYVQKSKDLKPIDDAVGRTRRRSIFT
jgi:hypothetical protein